MRNHRSWDLDIGEHTENKFIKCAHRKYLALKFYVMKYPTDFGNFEFDAHIESILLLS